MIRTGGRLGRIYARGSLRTGGWADYRREGPLWSARLDPHEQNQRSGNPGVPRVIYAAARSRYPILDTCVAEASQASCVIDVEANEPWFALWTPTRELGLLDLASAWTLRAGGTQAICTGDRRRSRQWARAIHAQFGNGLDGLTWPSSVLGGGRCVVLWDRAEDSTPTHPDFNRPLADPALLRPLAQVAVRLDYRLV